MLVKFVDRVSIVFILALIFCLSFSYAIDISSCQTISSPGDYVLTQNLSTTGTCIRIDTINRITLDCQGYTISGDGGSSDRGIYLSGANYNNVSNCVIDNFGVNLYVYFSDNNRFVNMSYGSDNGYDIHVGWGADNNYFDYIDFATTKARTEVSNQIIGSYNGDISSCTYVSWPHVNYRLMNDVSTTGTCMRFEDDYASLDCQGYTISGDGGSSDRGIFLSGANYNNVSNCVIDNFGVNLDVFASDNNRFVNMSYGSDNGYDIHVGWGADTNYFDYIDFNTTKARAENANQVLGSYNSDISSCTYVSWPYVNYRLMNDVSTTGTCMRFTDNYASLDCQGYTISGDGGSGDRGIFLSDAYYNNVSNCFIDNFGVNLDVFGSDNNRFVNMSYGSDNGYDIHVGWGADTNYFDYIDFNTTKTRAENANQVLGSYNADIYSCTYISWPRVNYRLMNNVSTTGTCMRFTDNYASLDCQGYTISGDGGSGDKGIFLSDAYYNNVSNCVVDNFGVNLDVFGSDNNRFVNMSYGSDNGYDIYVGWGADTNYFDYIDFNTTKARAENANQVLDSYNGDITTCTYISWPYVNYRLMNDVSTTGSCMLFRDNYASLDCQGYTISGDGGSGDRGIDFSEANSNNVSNCVVDNFGDNLYVYFSDNNRFVGNSFVNSVNYDLNLHTSADNNIVILNNFSSFSKIGVSGFNIFNTSGESVGNYYGNFVCSQVETRTYGSRDFEVCINPENVSLGSYYDYAPLAEWTDLSLEPSLPSLPQSSERNNIFPLQGVYSILVSSLVLFLFFLFA